ncbi:hypothetical protein BDV93DRAFT_549685 [Ceratobasidium sp. AG-I]|nr:hypothetical protein BDV93DRAFT_549685 [Ceratobasidium sp. AG-I]
MFSMFGKVVSASAYALHTPPSFSHMLSAGISADRFYNHKVFFGDSFHDVNYVLAKRFCRTHVPLHTNLPTHVGPSVSYSDGHYLPQLRGIHKITQSNGATEKWLIVHKPTVTKKKKQYNLEPAMSTIRASSSVVEIINLTSSQTGSQSNIAPDSLVPVTTKSKGTAKKRKAPESSNTPATDPPSSSKKPRKTGPNVETSSSSPLFSASPLSSRVPVTASASASVHPPAAASTTAKTKACSLTCRISTMTYTPLEADHTRGS